MRLFVLHLMSYVNISGNGISVARLEERSVGFLCS